MAYVDWNNDLSVAADAMDNQHKKIMDYINKLYDRNSAKASKSEIQTIIKDMAKVVIDHFSEEEKYMETMKYPDLEVHKKIHQDLLNKFTQYASEYDSGNGTVDNKFFQFLKMWIMAHIKGIDKKYSEFHAHGKKSA